jgi:hypothetical protein
MEVILQDGTKATRTENGHTINMYECNDFPRVLREHGERWKPCLIQNCVGTGSGHMSFWNIFFYGGAVSNQGRVWIGKMRNPVAKELLKANEKCSAVEIGYQFIRQQYRNEYENGNPVENPVCETPHFDPGVFYGKPNNNAIDLGNTYSTRRPISRRGYYYRHSVASGRTWPSKLIFHRDTIEEVLSKINISLKDLNPHRRA